MVLSADDILDEVAVTAMSVIYHKVYEPDFPNCLLS